MTSHLSLKIVLADQGSAGSEQKPYLHVAKIVLFGCIGPLLGTNKDREGFGMEMEFCQKIR